MSKILEHDNTIIRNIAGFENDHPYAMASLIALIFSAILLFYTPSLKLADDDDFFFSENVPIINIDKVKTPKRMVKNVFSADKGEVSESDDVNRARGSSTDANAVDLTSEFGWTPPKPISNLKRFYPKFAEEKSVDASVQTALVVTANGKITKVRIEYIKLNKKFPADIERVLKRGFIEAAYRTLIGAQFTPPVYQGKNVPVISLFTLHFRMKD